MIELLVGQTKNLAVLNSEWTQQLLITHCKSKLIDAIGQLNSYPNIQYEFLQKLVANHEFNELTPEVKLAYLTIMCQTDYYAVPNEILNKDFPLDEALKVCEKFNHTEAIISIQERLGRVEEAMNLFLERYKKKGYLSKISSANFDRDMEVLVRLFGKVKELPSSESKTKLFIKVVNQLSLAIPYGVQSSIRNSIVDHLIHISLTFLENEISSLEEGQKIVDKLISSTFYNLTFGDLQTFLLSLSQRIRTNKQLWNEYDSVCEFDDFKLDLDLYIKKKFGTKTSNNCIECKKKLSFTLDRPKEVIIFYCSHSYHIDCIEKNECPFCANIDKLEDRRLTQKAWSPDILDLNKLLQLNAELVTDTLQVAWNITEGVAYKTTDVEVINQVYEVPVYFSKRLEPKFGT